MTKALAETADTWVGAPAPDFTLRDGDDKAWALSEHRGRVVVLLFYPGDDTPVCTKQMCEVRNGWDAYVETGAEVVGISTDSVESHRRFRDHYRLPLRLLSDPGGTVSKAYGARSWLPGRAARAVVVIDAEGIIRYHKVERLSVFRPRAVDILLAVRRAQLENLLTTSSGASPTKSSL